MQAVNILRLYYAISKEILFYPDAELIQLGGFNPSGVGTEIPYFSLYPNPARDRVVLKFKDGEGIFSGQVKISSIQGNLVQKHMIHESTGHVSFSISNLAPGLYICSFVTESGQLYSQKLNVID